VIGRVAPWHYPVVSGADTAGRQSLLIASTQGVEPAVPSPRALPESATLDLRALFHGHHASIWRLLRRLGIASAELDDAVQEVFWVAARRLSDIKPGSESAFLYGVALRVGARSLRRQKALPPMDELGGLFDVADCGPSPEQAFEERRARKLLDEVLCRMPLELRTAFVLFELEGMSVKDIAELEDIPVGTASSRLRRAREEFSATVKRLRAIAVRKRGRF
jgi:RNA polymerase sigma-70 factor (ECF subfamily)